MEKKTQIGQIEEAIITHPGRTIMVDDVVKNTTGIPTVNIQNAMSKLVKKGLLGAGLRSVHKGPKTYAILSRDPLPRKKPGAKAAPKDPGMTKEERKEIKEIVEARRGDLSSAETGRSIILAYQDLQKEVHDKNLEIESLRSEVNKANTALRVGIKERDKTIEDLKGQLVLVRAKVKELEHAGDDLRFPLGNTPRLKALNGRKM